MAPHQPANTVPVPPGLADQFKESAVLYGRTNVVPGFLQPLARANGTSGYMPAPAQQKRVSDGTTVQPAKKAKAKSTPTIGAAAASKDVAKGKQSTKVQQPSAAEKGKAKAIMPDSASSSSSSDDDDNEASNVNDAADTSGDDTPLSALITRTRKQNTKSLSNISSRLPSDTAISFEDLQLRAHIANSHIRATASALALKHAQVQSRIRLEAATTTATICRAWKDYYTASKLAMKQGHSLPAPEIPPPTMIHDLPELPALGTIVAGVEPYSSKWFDHSAAIFLADSGPMVTSTTPTAASLDVFASAAYYDRDNFATTSASAPTAAVASE